MAFRSSCYPHSSSPMAAAPRFGARKPAVALSFSACAAAAHGCNPSPSNLSFAAATSNKVFEDQMRGIVCYRDDKGELVCEGYDEGPRLGMRLPEKACFPWPVGVQVTDFIHLATLQVFEDDANIRSSTRG
ncbi:uncharacterized protein LOC100841409 [Brachypodium distachyon]|uniref:Uncharacterized protein n=2 Tax=Brachypodium distachyon TaxID=15368 RepID=I1H046_BRADI|nr:uncharacterized protein LOC100841409 [Brachypodium distachyon]KQK19170.1 hypothetical protein BRADI_1g46710v3 [Brachypodium distachyon]PNT76279.1 hypothetical protein BRADI_1g46710v3 [Brachypodium distachyon]PNT76280.1 hypothetical protein BRADI_1g46710v3 [Brachypodium distachyon]|eukprot:XP_010227912.1 uncharacterized protein LOC100841409 [Brachypodium distachyon]